MYKSLIVLAFLSTALSGCFESGVNANCAALGAVGGLALGAVTHNNLAGSALVGGAAGAVAGDQGACR